MSELKITGKITKVLKNQTGQKKDGSGEWVKKSFVVDNNEQYNNIFCFEVFGQEKVENFEKYNKVGDMVDVTFNVSTNEWTSPQGELKYFTTLQAWKIFKSETKQEGLPMEEVAKLVDDVFEPVDNTKEVEDDLPF